MSVSDHISSGKTSRRRHLSILTGLLLVWGFLAAFPVLAFTGKDKIPPLNYDTKLTAEEYFMKSDEYNIKPLDNPAFAFKVRLPSKWIPLDADLNKTEIDGDLFRQLAVYTSPPSFTGRSIFRVRSVGLNTLIGLDNWMISYMVDMGFAMEGMKIVNPYRVEAQYTVFINNQPMAVRAVAELSGPTIIIAEYLVPLENLETERDDQVWAMRGYGLVSPDTNLPVETRTYSFVDIAKFDFPTSWNLEAPTITNIDRMNASVINIKELHTRKYGSVETVLQLSARIDVTLVLRKDDTKIQDEIARINTELAAKGLKLTRLLGTVKNARYNEQIRDAKIEAYAVASDAMKLAPHEYWVAVLQTPSRYYIIRLLTIGQDENFKAWAQNTEVFLHVLETISPSEDSTQMDEEEEKKNAQELRAVDEKIGGPTRTDNISDRDADLESEVEKQLDSKGSPFR